MNSADDLRAVQRELAGHVTRLDAADQASAAGSADPRATIMGRIRADRGISAEERLLIYSHGYFARIHDVLRDDYGALHALLGEAAFHDLAKLYLMAHPPRSHSLRDVGAKLPAFLAGPVTEVFLLRWPCAADLAALEWALVDVFDAPDCRVLDRAALAALAPADWATLAFALVPAHRILALAWPVYRLRQAWSSERPLPSLDPSPTKVLVHRHHEQVFVRPLGELEDRALALVREGCDFATVCGRAADEFGDAVSPSEVLALLERWLAEGILAASESTLGAGHGLRPNPARRARRVP